MTDQTEQNPLLAKEKKTWLGFFMKLAFFISVFVIIILTVLANMGGTGDHLKKMIEEFASENTRYVARIEKLNNVTFFPAISFDFEDMGFFRHAESKVSVGHIDRAQMSVGFWDVFLGRGRIRNISIINLHAAEQTLLDQPVFIKSLGIVDTNPAQALVEAKGTIGPENFTLSMDMQSWGSGRTKSYGFSERRNIALNLGELGLSSVLQNGINPYLRFQDFKITGRDGAVITGVIDLSKRRAHELTITGELTFNTHNTVIKPDLVFDLNTHRFTGTINSDNFNMNDFNDTSVFAAFVDRLIVIVGTPAQDGKILDNFFTLNPVTLNLNGEQNYQGPLVFVNNRLILKPAE
jgi:hypothetical protein